MNKFKSFLNDEGGAITVDWVVDKICKIGKQVQIVVDCIGMGVQPPVSGERAKQRPGQAIARSIPAHRVVNRTQFRY